MVYDFLPLGELLKMTRISKAEKQLILKVTHDKGLIKPKQLSIDIQEIKDIGDLRFVLPLTGLAQLSISPN